jgi:hypothetical protein
VAHGGEDPPAEQPVPGLAGQAQRAGEVPRGQVLFPGVVGHPPDIVLYLGQRPSALGGRIGQVLLRWITR